MRESPSCRSILATPARRVASADIASRPTARAKPSSCASTVDSPRTPIGTLPGISGRWLQVRLPELESVDPGLRPRGVEPESHRTSVRVEPYHLGNDIRGTGFEVRVAGVDRGDRVRADRQAAVAEGRYARGERFGGADHRGAVEEVHRTRRRARARRGGGDGPPERPRRTGCAGVGTGGERGRRARLVHNLGNGTRGTGSEVRVAGVVRGDRVPAGADRQTAGAECRLILAIDDAQRPGADRRGRRGAAGVEEVHRTRRRARARRLGGDGRRKRHRLTGYAG